MTTTTYNFTNRQTTMVTKKRDSRSRGVYQGMNWIRQEKRLSIYLRDGLSCVYCGSGVEDGAQLSLDHIICHSAGGSNHQHNLVTCCSKCNSSRKHRTVEEFAEAVAGYINHGVTAEMILNDIEEFTNRPLPKDEAKELIARRGSAAKAVAK